ncbi:MAG: choice-of-anchor P family protein [Nocardioidaceae bacterium]
MRTISRVVAVLATAALTAGGLAATTSGAAGAEPPAAKQSSKRFNFISSAYGTRVFDKNGDLVDSGRTAWSLVACTSETGKTKTDHLAKVELPGKQLTIGPVTTKSQSVKTNNGVKAVSTTKVGDIVLKSDGVGSLRIEGLKGVSQSSHKNGEYGQKGAVDVLSIKAGLGGIEFPVPIDPDDINPGQQLTIPGLAKLRFLDTKGKVKSDEAWNNSVALELKVLTDGPLEGQTVRIGSARTKLEGIAANGTMSGYGQAARAKLLDGGVSSGRIAHQPLHCAGTDGTWKKNTVAGVHLGPIRIGALSGQARGVNEPGKNLVAHTRARVAGAQLTNDLKIGAVESYAKVVKKNGTYKKSSGVTVLRVKAGGENWTKEINRAIKKQKTIKIPGIAKITANVVDRTKKSISVTALKIRLLGVAKPLSSTIRLANSKAKIG